MNRKFSTLILVALTWCSAATNAPGATPRDELLRLVPADAGFVVVVTDLRGHSNQLAASPFLKKWRESPMGQRALASPALQQLNEINQSLRRDVGADAVELRNEVLGDAIVLIWRPGPPGKPEMDDSLILVRPRDAAMAARVLAQVEKQQRKAGTSGAAQTRSHAGREYTHRTRTGEPDEFQYVRGNLIALGSGERLLKEVIAADTDDPVRESPWVTRFRQTGVGDAAVLWWINARTFDAHLETNRPPAQSPEGVAFTAVMRHWQACDAVAAYLNLGADAKMGLVIAARPDALPESTRRLFRSMTETSDVVSKLPGDALMSLTGRLDLTALRAAAEEFLPDPARSKAGEAIGRTAGATLGNDAMARLPEALGPDWGVCLSPPVSGASVPVLTIAVRLKNPADAEVVPRVLESLHTLATLAVLGYNTSHPNAVTLGSERQGGVEVRFAANEKVFPAGVRPSYAWKHGYLLMTSHPSAISRFPAESGPKPASAPVVRFSAPAWAEFLKTQRSPVAALIAANDKVSLEEAKKQVDGIVDLLGFISGIELTVIRADSNARIEITITTSAPLK
ncbi:MAG: hypothetical protein K1X57_03905 [Gemmataceae bacterium]|nr:hypothetical protein [Gemmataceae bacterium]